MDTEGCQPSQTEECPVCLIESRTSGQLCVNSEALKILSEITQPVVVVANVGPRNSGTSFLMERLTGKEKGFFEGSNGRVGTKGIWMWCMPHPTKRNLRLVLLVAEELDEVQMGNVRNNKCIFALSLFLSNFLIYNSTDPIDYFDLTHISENIDLFKLNIDKSSSGGPSIIARFLIWALQDFSSGLFIQGKKVTVDEYLENALNMKPGVSKRAAEFNLPRNRIRKHFYKWKGFMFESPIIAPAMNDMEMQSESQLNPNFASMARKFVDYIYRTSREIEVQPNCEVTGKVLATLVTTSLETITNQFMQSTTQSVMTPTENSNAEEERSIMHQYVAQKLEEQERSLKQFFHDECTAMMTQITERSDSKETNGSSCCC